MEAIQEELLIYNIVMTAPKITKITKIKKQNQRFRHRWFLSRN